MKPCRRPAGFTLIEVLVALAIVAISLMAGLKATGALDRQADRQVLALLGQICADNELIRLRLLRQLPDLGEQQAPCLQAGRELRVSLTVQPTPNPNFRRVDAQVFERDVPLLRTSTLVGRQ